MKTKVESKDRIKIGKELRRFREALGIRQDFIAKKLRVDSSKLCRMENGDFGPWSYPFIERWKVALGYTNGDAVNSKVKTPPKNKQHEHRSRSRAH